MSIEKFRFEEISNLEKINGGAEEKCTSVEKKGNRPAYYDCYDTASGLQNASDRTITTQEMDTCD